MTLNEAIAILNDRGHRGHSEWKLIASFRVGCCGHVFDMMETLAIATWYVSHGQAPVPGGLIGSAGVRPGGTVFEA